MNNPSAFPSHGSMGEVVQEGMTLLDYFAGEALPALMAHHMVDAIKRTARESGRDAFDVIAEVAYAYAKAMLKAREA